ncbi:MAG: alpha/beta hydrolase [Rhodocyclaceae bacterium]|nr:alpha/beta hydrolase [Rhodocyclaceae bacterium]
MNENNQRRDFLKAGGLLAVSGAMGALPIQAAAAPAMKKKSGQMSARPSIPGKKMMLNGINYHVGEQGTGDKVALLLHGMPDTSAVWHLQVPALVQAGYRVIAPDMLGYGETDKPEDVQRYKAEMLIGDMVAMLDTLGLKQVDLVGHDWGALVSWELALNFPERFRRHVALSVGHPDVMMNLNTVAEVKDSWYMYLNTQASAAAAYAANDGAFFKRFIIPTHPEVDEVWARMKDLKAMNGMLNWDKANPMADFYLAAASNTAAPRMGKVPTLGLWSTGDAYLWEAQVKDSAKLMSAPWRYQRIADASHWIMMDRAKQVNAAILDWFNKG